MVKLFGTGLLAFALVGYCFAADFEMDGMKSKIPDGWKTEEGSNKMRLMQAKLPKADGDSEDAELVIFYFGKGGGGGVPDNLKRWKDQFDAPEGKKIDDVSKASEFKINGDKVKVNYLIVENGTYKFKAQPFNPSSPVTEKKDFRLLGAIVESENGPYFLRVIGPKKTVEKHQKAFEEWIKAFK
ncbi:hypothetical protein KIH39_11325 [Telmatocola sphagniphila]|uniref:Uncharacterized protein n=1 Tax=Telmatocola sphagniphila TaxID=1123043 RepID=A0A8E6B9P6_9BACT|nr:hypothetical protein [Telmatocola sphagniphila]QVL34467.1 hypothetical protein KIH39_11325 [Telmatocola sphagniphila]